MELGPDGREEHPFQPLGEVDAELADAMRRRFVEKWLDQSGFPPARFDEAMAMVDVRVGPDGAAGTRRLRIASGFSGCTRCLYEWDGTTDEALTFAGEAAGEEAGWVDDERRLNGPTEWDQ